jgi:hypothetical protein
MRALVLLFLGVGAARAQDPTALRSARLTYLTTTTAYIDAGRLDGLRDSSRVEVRRGGATVGVLRVAFLASHQASCDIVSSTAALAVGDSVRFVPVALPVTARSDTAHPARPGMAATPGRRPRSMRGRVALEYFHLRQLDGTSGSLSQPSFDFRLDGPPPGASTFHVAVDIRARRTYTILPDGTAVTDGRGRVYQAAVSAVSPGSPVRFTVGRQISGDLASVGLFDGMLAELTRTGWSLGAFAGSQPEPLHLGFSGDIIEGGGYVQRHNAPGVGTPWTLTFGVSGSYQDNHTNREFAYAQGSYLAKQLTVFVTQEVDYYRPWKRLPGMSALSPTSTLALVQLRPASLLAFDVGFDNRRNVRLFRDVINPETSFDDTYRQGLWGGVTLQPVAHLRFGADARSSSGDPAGRADAYTATMNVDRVSPLALSLRTRSTHYLNPRVTGWLHSAAISAEPVWGGGPQLRLELNGGQRVERIAVVAGTSRVTWVGGGLDVALRRSWFVMFSGTWQRGGVEAYDQAFGGVSLRF